MLKQNGKDTVLIDADEIARGNTKNTTAKITSQHDLIYHKLISEFGEENARQYPMANEFAIKKYKEIIEERKIECDFEEKPAYNIIFIVKKQHYDIIFIAEKTIL